MAESIGRRREAAAGLSRGAPSKGKGNRSTAPSTTTTGFLRRQRDPTGLRPPPAAAAAGCRPSKGKEIPRPPPARRPESCRKGVSTIPALDQLMDQLRRLDLERMKVVELHLLRSQYETSAYLEQILAFVNTLELAHQYFDFKDYLRAFCGSDKYDFTDSATSYTLTALPEQLNMFDKLSLEDIGAAVNEHTFGMRDIIFDHRESMLHDREQQYRRVNHIASEQQLTAQDYETINHMFPCPPAKHRSEEDDTYAFSNPIFVSALQARKGDHVMHEYVEVELQNVKNSVKYFQNYYFVHEPALESPNTETDAEKVKNVTSKLTQACMKYDLLRLYCEKLSEAMNAVKSSVNPATDAIDKAAKSL